MKRDRKTDRRTGLMAKLITEFRKICEFKFAICIQ